MEGPALRLASPFYPALLTTLAGMHGHRASFDPRDTDLALLGPDALHEAAVLAAANPELRVWLLGPGHDADTLSTWQEEAGLDNVCLVANGLDDLDRLLLPEFSMIGLRWLLNDSAPAERRRLLEWCAGKLLAGGLVHLTYDSLPGAAARQLLRDVVLAVGEGEGPERLADGLAYLDMLRTGGAPLFQPDAGYARALDDLSEAPASVRQRHLLNPDWTPLHVTELSELCEAQALQYAGTSSRMANGSEVNVAAWPMDGADRLSAEQHLAFVTNDAQRGDLYAKAGSPRAGHGQAVEYLALDPTTTPMQPPLTWQELERSVSMGLLPAPVRSAAHETARRFNTAATERALFSVDTTVVLAAPALGGGVSVPVLDALYLAARNSATGQGVVAAALAMLERASKSVRAGDAIVSDADAALSASFEDLERDRLTVHVRLGLTEA